MLVVGVVNVTADSFSDGGRYLNVDRAVEHGRALAGQGAAIIDVGANRPGPARCAPTREPKRSEWFRSSKNWLTTVLRSVSTR